MTNGLMRCVLLNTGVSMFLDLLFLVQIQLILLCMDLTTKTSTNNQIILQKDIKTYGDNDQLNPTSPEIYRHFRCYLIKLPLSSSISVVLYYDYLFERSGSAFFLFCEVTGLHLTALYK